VAARPGLDVRAYAVSWRRRGEIGPLVPGDVDVDQRPMPARPLHALWRHVNGPPIEWFVGRSDVVHGTNFVVPPTGRAEAVVSVHDLTPLHHPELCDQATLAYPGLIRRALGRGAWVHTDSAFVANEVVEAFGAEPSRVRVVNPGIPQLPSATEADAAATMHRFLPPGTNRFCLAVGTAEPRKDLPGLVEAFSSVAVSHADVALVLAGPPGWGEDALTAAIETSPVRERIVRTGWLDEVDLAILLERAGVLAYPSLYEGFGFPPLQAMHAGVPVVATRAGSLPEVLGNGALLVEPRDHDALASALDACFGDATLRQRLATAGAAWSAHFSWERCGEGLEALYRDMAGGTGG